MYARRLRSIALLRRCGTAPARKPRLPPPPPPLTPTWQHPRFFSAEGDGRNNAAGKQVPVKDAAVFDKGKPPKEDSAAASHDYFTEYARLGEIDQLEWLRTEKLKMEGRIREPAFATRRQLFKKEFLRRLIPWEKIAVSWDKFPYYIDENVKKLLLECAAAHLKHRNCATMYGSQLHSSRRRILLQTNPGTELYRERVVKALARELQVPLLVLDSSVLAPFDFGDCSETELDEDNDESSDESTSTEAEDENNASNEEEYTDSNEIKSGESEDDDDDDDERERNKVLAKIVPVGCTLEEFAKTIQSASEPVQPSGVESSEQSRSLKKGDRVKYIGASVSSEVNRSLSNGQRGEVLEVNGDHVFIILDNEDGDRDGATESTEEHEGQPTICLVSRQHIERNRDIIAEEWYIAMEALCKVLPSLGPTIVYFPDASQWLLRAVPKSSRKEFIDKLQQMFLQLPGPVVLICGQNIQDKKPKQKDKFTMVLPHLGRIAKLPLPLKQLAEGLRPSKPSKENGSDGIVKFFTNTFTILPPKEAGLLITFNKQIEEDRKIIISRNNLVELHKVLEEHNLSCMELLCVKTDGATLTKQKAEKVVGWARNHYLSSVTYPSVTGAGLIIPRESLDIAITRLKGHETILRPSQNLKALAKDEYESNFISAVVPPEEIGVKFDDIGALEDVKRTLNELVTLPMRRPELFSHGNLLRPCKGILLFGPPGTGKTLLAKALATEAGANFISITGSSLTSKWFGDAEKLTKSLFSFASKLAPVIIFVDEVDSLLGARGGSSEHEATRRMRNEFMAAWDGLRSKDSNRILILGATNRPFDLDDAVIRRLPRRIYVDLPDAGNRMKILKILLSQENLDPSFRFDDLANATEGYSGSDLKNLCVAAAYRPVQELLEEEKRVGESSSAPLLRPLNSDDFIQAKSKVGASVAHDAASMNELRKWNEQYGEGGNRRHSPFGFGN